MGYLNPYLDAITRNWNQQADAARVGISPVVYYNSGNVPPARLLEKLKTKIMRALPGLGGSLSVVLSCREAESKFFFGRSCLRKLLPT